MIICSSKTTTEIEDNIISISCFADMNIDDTTFPDIYRADLLNNAKQINGIDGKEGELLLSYADSTVGEIVESELIIELQNDDVNKYEVDATGNMIYNG